VIEEILTTAESLSIEPFASAYVETPDVPRKIAFDCVNWAFENISV
jgi:hypothetical protein